MQIQKKHNEEAFAEFPMRSEQQMFDLILDYAKSEERIRVVTLEGSRTNRNIPADRFQDYDITFFVTDMYGFTADDAWLDVFGERLILQKPEDMELFPAEEKGYSYLMLFADGVKMDLTLLPLELLEEYVSGELWQRLLSTYRMASYMDMWSALEGCMELFREVSEETACLLEYPYPDYDEKISGYVKRQKEGNDAD